MSRFYGSVCIFTNMKIISECRNRIFWALSYWVYNWLDVLTYFYVMQISWVIRLSCCLLGYWHVCTFQ